MAKFVKLEQNMLKRYFVDQKLPSVYEALLSGLVVMCPSDSYQFIIDKLRYLKEHGLDSLRWDLFIEEHMKPKNRVISDSNLEWLFDLDDGHMPTSEMYEKAYNFVNTHSKLMCFRAWMRYHLLKRSKMNVEVAKLKKAAQYYTARMQRIHFQIWAKWVRFRKGRQTVAFNIIQHAYSVSFCRVVFESWHNAAVDAERTRQYFENPDSIELQLAMIASKMRLERGENVDDEDALGRGNGDARDDISALERKVAHQIFSYVDLCDLGRCAQVCRSWKVLVQHSALWNRINLNEISHRLHDKTATKILDRAKIYVLHLNMRQCSSVGMPAFHAVSRCRNLQDLNLSECSSLTDEMFSVIASGCKILLYLNISYTRLTDASLRVISQDLFNLQYLSLACCDYFSDKGLAYLAQGACAKRLLHLDLSGCLQITPEGYEFLSHGCTNIQTLVLDFLPMIDDRYVKDFVTSCKNLQNLSLLGTPNLSDEFFIAVTSLKKLQQLKITNNQKITDNAFKDIGKNCLGFRHFYVTDCVNITDATLKHLSPCKNLTVLNVADCVRISDLGIRQLCDSPAGNKLRELNVTNCMRVGDTSIFSIHKRVHGLAYLSACFCEKITDSGIELIGQMHGLVSVDLSGCKCTDAGLSALGNITRLRDLNLTDCAQITDLGLQKFSQQCTELERIDLSYCYLLTDAAIKNLAFSCRLLTYVVLAGCRLLTDLSVQYLTGVCHNIRHLDISSTEHITDKALKYIRTGCKQMQTLVILHCKNITRAAVSKLHKDIPNVQFTDDSAPAHYG